MSHRIQPYRIGSPRKMRIGFVPLTDCAPLVMARELGLFKKFGLQVELSRELGWATVRDKIIFGELEAAHALAAMPLAATLGLGSIPCDCLTATVLNLHGNAITLSADLWKNGVRDGRALREEIFRVRRQKTFTFGIVFPFSSHRQLLRNWLAAGGIDPDRDVRFVVIPPPQMAANLKAGHIDGFCAGEPWNSLAVHARAGWIAATSAQLDAGHPEKVLMVRSDLVSERPEEHLRLIAALREAGEFCAQPENCGQIAATLARKEFVGVAEEILLRGLSGNLDCGFGETRRHDDVFIFHSPTANDPSAAVAAWALQLVRAAGDCRQLSTLQPSVLRKVYRTDLFAAAAGALPPVHITTSQETFTH